MTDNPSSSDLSRFLFPEEDILRGDFREYFLRKRFNLIATINSLQDVTDLFLHVTCPLKTRPLEAGVLS